MNRRLGIKRSPAGHLVVTPHSERDYPMGADVRVYVPETLLREVIAERDELRRKLRELERQTGG